MSKGSRRALQVTVTSASTHKAGGDRDGDGDRDTEALKHSAAAEWQSVLKHYWRPERKGFILLIMH